MKPPSTDGAKWEKCLLALVGAPRLRVVAIRRQIISRGLCLHCIPCSPDRIRWRFEASSSPRRAVWRSGAASCFVDEKSSCIAGRLRCFEPLGRPEGQAPSVSQTAGDGRLAALAAVGGRFSWALKQAQGRVYALCLGQMTCWVRRVPAQSREGLRTVSVRTVRAPSASGGA